MSDDDKTPPAAPSPPGKKRQPGWENVLKHRIKTGEVRNPGGINGAPWRNMMRKVALEKVVDPVGADLACKVLISEHAPNCQCKNKRLISLFRLLVKSAYMQALKGSSQQTQYLIDQMAGRAHQSIQVEQTGGGAGQPMVLVQMPDDGSAADLDNEDEEEDGVGEEPEETEDGAAPALPPVPDGEE